MSQVSVASRPATQQSLAARLPEIQHPLSRMSHPGTLDVRGSSRGGERPASHQGSLTGRPLANEATYSAPRRLHSSASDRALRASLRMDQPPLVHESIPEGVEVTHGDPSKTKLPVFGSRTILPSRGDITSRAGSRASYTSAQGQLEIEELETILRDRVKASFFEVKKKFKDNDPEQKGNVSKEALFRIIVTTINRPLNQQQFSRLMERLGFRDKAVVNFTEFFTCFREPGSATEYPRWMDPIQRQDKATMTASQVHMHLKERARQRVKDIADLIPQTNPDGSGHILKPEFRNVLDRMGFYMDDDEFEKLWSKYDTEGTGTINGERMMAKMGISISTDPGTAPRLGMSHEGAAPIKPLKKKEADRQRSLHIERWLKRKFREGFSTMRSAFHAFDHDQEGQVTHDEFLEVLAEFGLRLEKPHLAEFLARCNVEPTKTHVPYREFLHRFQDRSEGGMAHNILTNAKHRYNRADSPGAQSSMSALETQLLNMFQRDFLTLLGKFHNIDKVGADVVSQEEFRAAIESHFDLPMSDSQFQSFVDRLPLDTDGNVRYAEFMAQFDTRGKAPSLFADPPVSKSPEPARPASPPRSPKDSVVDRLVVHEEPPVFDTTPRRSPHELFKIIKELLNKHYQEVEEAFYDLDEINSRRLTQDMMYELLQRFDIRPEITRGEIRDLWKTFITNQDKTLDFLQFTRHFGYSLRSAAFPNAKVSPPKRGDADYMLRSRKLNCAADMLQDSLRAKIDYMWEQLGQEFVAMDTKGTGLVPTEDFREVLTELCVHLSDYELNMLVRKFQTAEGKVSYVEFLKPFAMKRQTWRHGNNMLSLLQHPQSELPIPDIVNSPTKGLTGITAKLRQKLSGDWKNLRRAFKKLDTRNEGYLSLPEFRSVLKLANVLLDEDEVYHVMSQFDTDMSGRIPYNKFLNETFKTASRASVVRSSAEV